MRIGASLVKAEVQLRGVAGHVRIMTTGSAPISTEVMEFLRICFGATVIEGYGMTETACTITLTHPDDTSCGHVGGPLPCCEIKLADLPEMNYLNSDRPYPRGEVSVASLQYSVPSQNPCCGVAPALGPPASCQGLRRPECLKLWCYL